MINNNLIADLFLFKNLDFSYLNTKYNILTEAVKLSYKDNDLILSSNDSSRGIGIIESGHASVYSSSADSAPVIRTLSKGDTFGAAFLFASECGCSTVTRAKEDCSVIFILADTVKLLCISEPMIALNYISFLSNRINFLNKKITGYSAESTDAKIAVYLYDEYLKSGECLDITVSYSFLSELLGVGRASLYRALDHLTEMKLIERNKKKITLLEPHKLKLMIK